MSSLTKQERTAKIGEIVEKVTQMTDEQLGNIHEYTSDEFEEPKCSSPTGDGNIYPFIRAQNNKLY